MKNDSAISVGVGLLVAVGVLVGWPTVGTWWKGYSAGPLFSECGDDVEARALSPDGRWVALVLTRNCGATTRLLTVIAIGNTAEDAAKGKEAVWTAAGVPEVTVAWASSEKLVVVYRKCASDEIGKAAPRFSGVSLEYREGAPLPAESDQCFVPPPPSP
jgi:hypothetical protein